jgi:hypothetical protein
MAADADRFDWRDVAGSDELDELFGAANPNPDRIGCPSADTLVALARRDRPMDDPAYAHLAECSPCYREFRLLQQEGSASAARGLFRSRSARWGAAAALLLLLVVGGWLYARRGVVPDTPVPPPLTVASARALELDLRPYTVSRSEQGTLTQPPLALSAERLDLTLLLPVGSEPGPHDVRLLGVGDQVLARAFGQADIRDFVTTLRVEIDLSAVPAGEYQFAVRREGDDWALYPAVVR